MKRFEKRTNMPVQPKPDKWTWCHNCLGQITNVLTPMQHLGERFTHICKKCGQKYVEREEK